VWNVITEADDTVASKRRILAVSKPKHCLHDGNGKFCGIVAIQPNSLDGNNLLFAGIKMF